ncbi:hypothetical protein ACHAXR_000349, partial [Thalassiosira sp. AJA248-18]
MSNLFSWLASTIATSAVEFEYTGEGSVPKNVTRVKFHSAVTEVGDEAFLGCRKLKEVVLNEGLQKIGRRSFQRCESLDNIRLPSSVTEIGGHAFLGCSNLRDVVLNEGIQKIGERAFGRDCSSLECIKFPSTVTEVGDYAFNG